MDYLKLDDFRKFRFISQLKISPSGKNTAVIVKIANEKNDYNSVIYADCGEGFKPVTRLNGSVSQFLWKDEETILFAENREGDAPKYKDQPFTTFYSINVNGGEAKKAFAVEMGVSNIEMVNMDTYIIHTLFDNNAPDFTGKTPDEINTAIDETNKEKDYQVIDELPYWTDGGSFINKKRMRIYVYNETVGLKALTGPLSRAESFVLSDC
ncbi:MAG: hypothetical protein LBU94_04490, partial [Clostridiales bacterium]|nr:hypothetical protein [Clostridiales bacterium]